jgi:predicted RNase H-like nuclease (RuvC/YqgF family)
VVIVVAREHKEEVDRMESDFAEKLEKKKEMEMQLAISIEERQKYVKELEQERDAYKMNKGRMEAEINQSNKSHDEEVKLRLKFESKLNKIYSVHRDLQRRVSSGITIV